MMTMVYLPITPETPYRCVKCLVRVKKEDTHPAKDGRPMHNQCGKQVRMAPEHHPDRWTKFARAVVS